MGGFELRAASEMVIARAGVKPRFRAPSALEVLVSAGNAEHRAMVDVVALAGNKCPSRWTPAATTNCAAERAWHAMNRHDDLLPAHLRTSGRRSLSRWPP